MRKLVFSLGLAFILSVMIVSNVSAQRNVAPAFDPIMEADAKHNLDVAWQAFNKPRLAYKQVLLRFEETYAAYPEFSGMGTFLYLAGMSSYYLSENKGKQKVNLKIEKERQKYDPDKLRKDAKRYLTMVVERYDDSVYVGDAKKTLELLKDVK